MVKRLLILLILYCCISNAWGLVNIGREFGGYVLQQMVFFTPANPGTSLSNGNFNLEAGWIEPIIQNPNSTFKNTYLNPVMGFDVSPYHSNYWAVFRTKFLPWALVGAGYKRLLYHGTLIGFDSMPPNKADWRSSSILQDIPISGELAGADIFFFQFNVHLNLGFGTLQLNEVTELWNVDAVDNNFIYQFNSDLLIQVQDNVHYFETALLLFEDSKFSPVIKNEFLYAREIDIIKNKTSLGICELPLSQKHAISMDLYWGYWTNHPHLKIDDFLESLTITAHFIWDVKLLAK